MHKPRHLICLLAISVICVGCTEYNGSVEVPDVRKEEIIILRHKDDSRHVYELRIRETGKIAGEADISLVLNGKDYKNEKLNDAVNFTWGGDWYSDTAELRYIPKSVGSEKLLIENKFSSM